MRIAFRRGRGHFCWWPLILVSFISFFNIQLRLACKLCVELSCLPFDQTGRFDVLQQGWLEKRLNVFLDTLKAFSVNGTVAVFPDGFPVRPGWISFVFWKIELRIVMMVFLHQVVTGDFGND